MLTADPLLFSFTILGKTFDVTAWTLFGLVMGNALFTSRVLVQWVLSERAGRSVSPPSYWWLSLIATVAMIAYGLQRMEAPFILGFAVNLAPYTRNLMLSYRPTKGAGKLGLCVCGAVVAACVGIIIWRHEEALKDAWVFFGFAGIVVFYSRFLIQWLHSERVGRSELPLSFWYMSLIGALILLVYGLKRADVVYILGYLFNAIPYVRNIMLIYRARAKERSAASTNAEPG